MDDKITSDGDYSIQIIDREGNVLGSIGSLFRENKKWICEQFFIRGDQSVAKFYADRLRFNIVIKAREKIDKDYVLFEKENCIIADHSFCYPSSDDTYSIADKVTIISDVGPQEELPIEKEEYEKWLQNKFAW